MMSRKFRKGAVELLIVALTAGIGYVLDQPETFGLGAISVWGLQQVRRVLRDWQMGEPL